MSDLTPAELAAQIIEPSEVAKEQFFDLTPAYVAATLTKISKGIIEQAETVANYDAKLAEARRVYRKSYAKAFLTAEGSNDVKRYSAELATADEWFVVESTEQVLRAAREALRVLRDRLEAGRSLGAIMRSEWGN